MPCYSPAPAICGPTDVRCDSGNTGACWHGDYCMPEGTVCPFACMNPEPMMCAQASDISCDNGLDSNGCSMGTTCLPAGNICPTPCSPHPPANCSATEVVCDMGMTGSCWNGDFCMPEGSVCPVACYTPDPAMCGPTEVLCDNGIDSNNCWMGNYC